MKKARGVLFFFLASLFLIGQSSAAGQKPVDQTMSAEATESICPTCHSKENVVPIVYGYPAKTLMDEAEAGKVKLGGCILRENNPHWFCKKCDKSW